MMWRFSFVFIFFMSVACADFPTPERQHVLRNMLEHDCGACHGLTLQGGLGTPLTSEALVGKSDDFLMTAILDGRKGTAMPPWRQYLSDGDARWLIQQLRKSTKETYHEN
jgi:cytochrome c55X